MTSTTRPIEIRIDRLALHGLAVDDADTFGLAVGEILTDLVQRGGLEPPTATAGRRPGDRPVSIELPARPERRTPATHLANTVADRELAHRVAEGVYRSLGGTP